MTGAACAAIVLAAGLSSRLGPFKPLLDLGGETLADRVIGLFRKLGVDVYLVAGWRQEELRAGIRSRDITIVPNPDYAAGMFTSVRAGLRRLGAGYQAFFIMPVDIPLVRPFTIKRLLQTAAEHPGRIIYPVFGSRRGHPPLIPAALAPDILVWEKDGGLKSFLAAREAMAVEIKVPDGNILFDVDTPQDYAALQERFRRGDVPTEAECEAIMEVAGAAPEVYRHGLRVAGVALAIGRALAAAGQEIDLDTVRAAAVLHDIAKGQSKHDAAGGQMLREMGFGRAAAVMESHTDLPEDDAGVSIEAKLVYLADKYAKGDTLVSIEERFRSSRSRFGTAEEIEARIKKRRARVQQIKNEFEGILGRSIESIVFE